MLLKMRSKGKEISNDILKKKGIIPYHKPFPLDEDRLNVLTKQIKEVLKSGQLTNGKYVKELEDKIKEMYGVEFCIATSNCTMGITFCFQYLENSPYLTIEMPNFTWISPYLMISHLQKVFVDIDKETWLMKDLGRGLKLSFPTHTFGNIIEIENDNKILYDGAQALGSVIKKFGDATVLSLAPTKLVTSCEGGLVLTNQEYLAKFVRFRRDKCARMSEVHALIGLKTFEYLDIILNWKEKVYNYYKSYIPGQFQEIPIHSNYNTIGFLNTEKLEIPEHIETKQYYEPVFDMELMPNAFEVYKQMVCLPSYYDCPYIQIVEDILEVNEP